VLALQATVSPTETMPHNGEVKTDWLSRHGVDTTALGSVLGCAAVLVSVAIAIGMRPEAYRAPAGRPLAIGLLGVGLLWSVWLLTRRPVPYRPQRRRLHIAAVAMSVLVFLWVPALSQGVYHGVDFPARVLVGNVSVWVPIALLLASLALATISGRRRRQLVAWAVITILALALMLVVVLMVGVEPLPS
jgi:hypothetical protein